jgi:alpha-galactosidase
MGYHPHIPRNLFVTDKKANPELQPTRRSVLTGIGAAALAAVTPNPVSSAQSVHIAGASSESFFDILRMPDAVRAFSESDDPMHLQRSGTSLTWSGSGIDMSFGMTASSLVPTLNAPSTSVTRIHLRWTFPVAPGLQLLGDAWERSYGELAWHPIVPEQAMPWYFLAYDGRATHAYGVATGAAAFAFWQCDLEGVSLWLDVRNGGNGVLLGQRTLQLATVVSQQGSVDVLPFAAAKNFCKILCASPSLPATPIYGSNDWYYAYGKSSADDIIRDAELMAELAPASGPRPYTVIDEGWEHSPKFPSMPGLAAQIKSHGVRPGIWVRPLRARGETNTSLLLPAARFGSNAGEAPGNLAWDPTIPEARAKALKTISDAVSWNYEMIKHDFTTFDLLGQWGSQMGASPSLPGWSFHDRSHTNAEIIRAFYEDIRRAAGSHAAITGCNVVGHLSAGLFEAQRTGDDVSGKIWERTRRMGVNTLAFRLPQHNTFFAMDPDCIPVTAAIPWSLTKMWMEAVAASGAALVLSPSPGSLNAEKKSAVREAFAIAASGGSNAQPVDWLQSRTPSEWTTGAKGRQVYHWLEPEGAYPFGV